MSDEVEGMMEYREKLWGILSKPIFPHEKADPLDAVTDYLIDNDVLPVVHAHWDSVCKGKIRVCSACGEEQDATFHDIDHAWRFCPNCGAKMDEEVKK